MLVPVEKAIGNTPLVKITNADIDFYAKLESQNIYGSMKDRAALYLLKVLIERGIINGHSQIIESSSGNFAVSVAGICNTLGIPFTCVTDPLMNVVTRNILNAFGARIITIDKPDENNIYVSNRIRYIENALKEDKDLYWINQYDNYMIVEAYQSLAKELLEQHNKVEYIFIPVSSCGTISGVSKYIKQEKPSVRVIAVDLESSSIFQKPICAQKLPAMGFNRKPGNIRFAKIDDVVIVDELSCVYECRQMLQLGLLLGPSSGAVIAAIKKYRFFNQNPEIIAIFPDKGDRYLETVYNTEWCEKNYQKFHE